MKQKVAPARWKRKQHLFRADEYICSRCSAASAKPYRHCPHCHAAMAQKKSLHWIDELEIFYAATE